MKDIRVNAPGAGAWIMSRCEGAFRPELDHSISSHDGERILGGFVLCSYLGNSIAIHDAADDKRWCSREMLRKLFHYVFVQLRCHKAFAPVASDNYHALELNLRAGWKVEAVLRDALDPGRHLIILAMEAGTCPWIRVSHGSTTVVRKIADHG